MSVNTLVKNGIIQNIDRPVHIEHISDKFTGEVHYNPSMVRDDKGNIWVSIRSCIHNPERFKGYNHPMHYQNFLHIGKFNEETFEITDLKEVVPDKEYPGFQWGIEDVRLFWREDGLHGIGVILPILETGVKANQAEILIDYEKGTYKLVKDYGHPKGTMEKNWMPAETPQRLFDFIYSPSQIVIDGIVVGEDNDLFYHNGTILLPYEDGFISIMHSVISVKSERTYATLAVRWSKDGKLTHTSQFFHFNVGWRQKLKETIEFVSGILWAKGKEGEELILGLGVKDELVGFCRVPVSDFEWSEYHDTMFYRWKWASPPNRDELEPPTLDPAYLRTARSHAPKSNGASS